MCYRWRAGFWHHSAPSVEVTEEKDVKTRYQKGKADCSSVYLNDMEIDVSDGVWSSGRPGRKKNYGHRHMDSGTDEKDVNGYTEE